MAPVNFGKRQIHVGVECSVGNFLSLKRHAWVSKSVKTVNERRRTFTPRVLKSAYHMPEAPGQIELVDWTSVHREIAARCRKPAAEAVRVSERGQNQLTNVSEKAGCPWWVLNSWHQMFA